MPRIYKGKKDFGHRYAAIIAEARTLDQLLWRSDADLESDAYRWLEDRRRFVSGEYLALLRVN